MDSGCDYPIIAALIFGIWWIIVLLFLWFMVGFTKQEGEYEVDDTRKKDRRIAYRKRTVSDLKAIERKRKYAKARSKAAKKRPAHMFCRFINTRKRGVATWHRREVLK